MRVLGPDALERRLSQFVHTMISCTACGSCFSFEEGESRAVHVGIKEEAVLCAQCGAIFAVDVTPDEVIITADLTSQYGRHGHAP